MSVSNIGESNRLSLICDFCFLQIQDDPLIQCHECRIDICLYCFYDQSESPSHSKFHKYRLVLCSRKIDENSDWTIMEEFLFLYGLERCGIGNWESICESIGSKNIDEVENKFFKLFGIEEQVKMEEISERTSNPYRSDISIYMPNRKDFDVEYFNEYEEAMKDIENSDSDDEVEKEIKKSILDGYDMVKNMRDMRKYMIIDRGLVDMKKNIEKDINNNEHISMDKYKFILPFVSRNDYNKFLEGIYNENFLYKKLSEFRRKIRVSEEDLLFFLSFEEKNMCKSLNISIKEYTNIKKIALNSKITKNNTFVNSIKHILRNDESKITSIFSFLQDQGWLNKIEEI